MSILSKIRNVFLARDEDLGRGPKRGEVTSRRSASSSSSDSGYTNTALMTDAFSGHSSGSCGSSGSDGGGGGGCD